MSSIPSPDNRLAAPAVFYTAQAAQTLLEDSRVLAVLGFSSPMRAVADPRALTVHLRAQHATARHEVWQVDGPVRSGRDGALQWAESDGWLFAAVNQPDSGGDITACARQAYATLTGFLADKPGFHVQRIWNYLDRINLGDGDHERYRQFCSGRRDGMQHYFEDSGFPAATAIGHAEPTGVLQLYCLAAASPGLRIENPRQLSAWHYPRQYGPVSPSFARAMRLPGDDALAISGTAAIQGHSSRHGNDLDAQLSETLTNIRALLDAGAMPGALGANSPLKVYVRHSEHMAAVDAFLVHHLPDAPRLLLQADICRRELLVEIDGWHFV